mgnify:CR=1
VRLTPVIVVILPSLNCPEFSQEGELLRYFFRNSLISNEAKSIPKFLS